MKTMFSKYSGTCTSCRQPIKKGEEIQWSKATGAVHLACSQKPAAGPDRFDMAYEDQCAAACGFSPVFGM